MSKWISLSDLSSRNNVVETTIHGHTIFEVPVGQKTKFKLDIDRLRTLQSQKNMMYFVYQDVKDFGEETWGTWKNGPAPMALHQYFNHLDGGQQNYTPKRVKNIGNNYITAFKIGDDGRVNWSRDKKISHTPSEMGQGIWLETLYYSPDWGNMGTFIIGVETPQVLSLFAKIRDNATYDPDEDFINGIVNKLQNVKYGDTIDLHIGTHRIIPDRYNAEVEILHQGTRVYDGKKRLGLDKYASPNNPALEYNLEMIESLLVDPGWEQAIGHVPGTIQTYTFRLTFEPKNTLTGQSGPDGNQSAGGSIIKEFEFEVTTNFFDFKFPVLSTNPQIIGIQEETLTPIEHEECRYSALKVTIDKQQPQVILKENLEQGVLEANLIDPVIHIVAGDNGKKKVTIQLTDVVTEECADNPSHTDNIFVYNDVVGQWEPEKSKDKLVLKPKYEYSGGWLGVNINPVGIFEYIWPKRDELIQSNSITIQTCRYVRRINLKVCPDIKWSLEFKWNHKAAFTYTTGNKLHPYDIKTGAEKLLLSEMDRTFAKEDGEMAQSFEMSLNAKWSDDQQKLEIGKEWGKRIAKTLKLFVKMKEATDFIAKSPVNGGKITFEIKAPVIAVSAQWMLKTVDGLSEIGTQLTLGIESKPLLEADGKINLWKIFREYGPNAICPGAGTVLNFVLDHLEGNVGIHFLVIFNGSINVKGQISGNTLAPNDTKGEIEVIGKIQVTLEFKAWANGDIGMAGFEGYLKADVSTHVSGGVKGEFSKEGICGYPVLKFGGIIAKYVAVGTVKFGIFKRTFSKEGKYVIVKPDEAEFNKSYIVGPYKN